MWERHEDAQNYENPWVEEPCKMDLRYSHKYHFNVMWFI